MSHDSSISTTQKPVRLKHIPKHVRSRARCVEGIFLPTASHRRRPPRRARLRRSSSPSSPSRASSSSSLVIVLPRRQRVKKCKTYFFNRPPWLECGRGASSKRPVGRRVSDPRPRDRAVTTPKPRARGRSTPIARRDRRTTDGPTSVGRSSVGRSVDRSIDRSSSVGNELRKQHFPKKSGRSYLNTIDSIF
jgi:hypothetical protein